jgi:hypothetical protein
MKRERGQDENEGEEGAAKRQRLQQVKDLLQDKPSDLQQRDGELPAHGLSAPKLIIKANPTAKPKVNKAVVRGKN